MAPDPKGKKRKAAPSPTSTAKKVKNSAIASTRAGKKNLPLPVLAATGNPAPVASLVGGATRKRAADFFDESDGESGDGGWDQLDTQQASTLKRPKNIAVNKRSALKPEMETSKARSETERANAAVTTAKEQQVEEVTSRRGTKKRGLKSDLKGSSLVEEPRKSKKPQTSVTAEKIEKATADRTEELALEPEGSKKSKTNGVSRVGKKGHSQENAVKDTVTESEAEESGEEDDQIAALLKGFESSDNEDESQHEDFTEGQAIPALPSEKKTRKKLKGVEQTRNDTPGVIYVGRIPHGFYEREMRSYFTQFGEILRLRLSRNRKTGRSKHYAFIEFASPEVARIVAETMDNYLMFGHILKCKIVPQEQVHKSLWKGANRRFKKIPRNRIEGRKLEIAASKESWVKRVHTELKRRKGKAEKLKALGYEFDVPTLKKVRDVEKIEETKLITGGSEMEVTLEETSLPEGGRNAISISEEVISRKVKKVAKKVTEPDAQNPSTIIASGAPAGKKKRRVETEDLCHTASTVKAGGEESGSAGKPKGKKGKKWASNREVD